MRISNNFFLLNAFLALAYFIGGYLGHLLATPPSNASPIWPAAGVAMASIYVYGNRGLLGIFLGMIAAQTYAFLDVSSLDKTLASLWISFLISIGGCLQALFANYLVSHLVGKDDPLITDQKIWRFVLLAGPVSCIVSPTIGIGTLYVQNIIGLGDWWLGWMAWWAGDAIGVIIVAPLMLLFIGQPRADWRLRTRYVAYPLLFSLVVVMAVFEYCKRLEEERIAAVFSQQANLLHSEIENRLNQHIKINLALKAFFDSSDAVGDSEFQKFASAINDGHLSLQALEWIPCINGNQRHELETKKGFVVKELAFNGNLVPSKPQPYYLPIYYIQPTVGNERALGFDINNNPFVKPIADAVIDTGVTSATAGINLVQDVGQKRWGIVLYSPVYQKGQLAETPEQRRQFFRGFVATAFHVADEVNAILRWSPSLQLSFTIKDSEQQATLFSTMYSTAAPVYGDLHGSKKIAFAGRVWVLDYLPSSEFYASQQSWAIWWLLLGGFLLCGLTSLGALLLTGRAACIEKLVETKTLDLQQTNISLKNEISKRKYLQSEQEIRNRVLESLTKGDSLLAILDFITEGSGQLYQGIFCSIQLFDERRHCLHHGSTPNLPDFYKKAIENLVIWPTTDVWGRVIYGKEALISEDLLTDPAWLEYKGLVSKTPFKSCWLNPVLATNGRVLGIFAIYRMEKWSPSQQEMAFIKNMLRLTAVAIEGKQNEQELLIAATTFQSHEAIVVTDHQGTILRVNKAFTEVTGYSQEEAIGQNPKMLASGKHSNAYYQNMYKSLFETGQWQGEIWNRRKDGQVYPEWLTLTVVKDQQNEIVNYVGIFSDISEIKEAEKEIHSLAYYDPLTSLPNRRLLLDRLKHEMVLAKEKGKFGALFFLDLDRFKTLNDSLGHHVGDALLIQVAERLLSLIDQDDTPCRLGGDEFIVLVSGKSDSLGQAAKRAAELAKRILAAINEPFMVFGSEQHFSTSIGVTLYPKAMALPEVLIQQADTAMYQAKESGRNGVSFFKPSMQESADRRLTLDQELRRALQEGQFQMYYQGQVDSRNRLVSAEALIRWQHPEKGMISPADFISLAEETNLIVQIGQWVLNDVCRQVASWGRQGKVLEHIAVNVSSKQFRQADFVDQVEKALISSGLSADRLMIELTEGSVIENMEDTIAKMHRLKAMGVSISIDDFGVGYSSLLYLKKLPLTQLKIDQSFVRDIMENASDAVIVETIINMAKNLGLNVIAEGVETEQQVKLLQAKGCFFYQGYYFSKPEMASQFKF